MKKFLAIFGGLAIAVLLGCGIAYGTNEGFRTDVNNAFNIEWSQTDETPDDTTGDETPDDETTGDNTEDETQEGENSGDNSSDIPLDGPGGMQDFDPIPSEE